jgi:hypothetical protein
MKGDQPAAQVRGSLGRRWREEVAAWEQFLERAVAAGASVATDQVTVDAPARLLHALASLDGESTLRDQAKACAEDDATDQSWFAEFGDPAIAGPAGLLAMVVFADVAAEFTISQRTRRQEAERWQAESQFRSFGRLLGGTSASAVPVMLSAGILLVPIYLFALLVSAFVGTDPPILIWIVAALFVLLPGVMAIGFIMEETVVGEITGAVLRFIPAAYRAGERFGEGIIVAHPVALSLASSLIVGACLGGSWVVLEYFLPLAEHGDGTWAPSGFFRVALATILVGTVSTLLLTLQADVRARRSQFIRPRGLAIVLMLAVIAFAAWGLIKTPDIIRAVGLSL